MFQVNVLFISSIILENVLLKIFFLIQFNYFYISAAQQGQAEAAQLEKDRDIAVNQRQKTGTAASLKRKISNPQGSSSSEAMDPFHPTTDRDKSKYFLIKLRNKFYKIIPPTKLPNEF